MTYRTVTVDVDVDVELDEFDDDELIDELERRGKGIVHIDPISRHEAQYLRSLLDAARQVSPRSPAGVNLYELDDKLSALS
jgi:hypothetical protein